MAAASACTSAGWPWREVDVEVPGADMFGAGASVTAAGAAAADAGATGGGAALFAASACAGECQAAMLRLNLGALPSVREIQRCFRARGDGECSRRGAAPVDVAVEGGCRLARKIANHRSFNIGLLFRTAHPLATQCRAGWPSRRPSYDSSFALFVRGSSDWVARSVPLRLSVPPPRPPAPPPSWALPPGWVPPSR